MLSARTHSALMHALLLLLLLLLQGSADIMRLLSQLTPGCLLEKASITRSTSTPCQQRCAARSCSNSNAWACNMCRCRFFKYASCGLLAARFSCTSSAWLFCLAAPRCSLYPWMCATYVPVCMCRCVSWQQAEGSTAAAAAADSHEPPADDAEHMPGVLLLAVALLRCWHVLLAAALCLGGRTAARQCIRQAGACRWGWGRGSSSCIATCGMC
jgi:hypothetical protein